MAGNGGDIDYHNFDQMISSRSPTANDPYLTIKCDMPVNHFSLNRNQNLLLAAGDWPACKVYDVKNQMTLCELQNGHQDHNHSTGWSACGNYMVTGGQDQCAIVWDIRNPSNFVHLIPTENSAVASAQFLGDLNNKLVIAER